MASSCWSEVISARDENKKELNLQGSSDINKRIEENGLDENIFRLVNLNLLKISRTPLTCLSPDLGKLVQLTSLSLENNKLEEIPETIKHLTSLKFLDVSGNKLQSLPNGISELSNIQSLNANLNSLTSFPDVSSMKSLAYLYISRNQLESLPAGVCSPNLSLLSSIDAAHNKIKSIPSEISQLCHLIKLDISDNNLNELPLELCECPKLKEISISENKLKDRKCLKLADHSTKALLAHLSNLLEKQRAADSGGKSKKGKGGKAKKQKKQEIEDLSKDMISIVKLNSGDGLTVSVNPGALKVRPYIVCCIIRNINFGKSNNMFKRFITLQTKLHDSICDKRKAATIATHDLKAIKGPLVYRSDTPGAINIIPLFKSKETSAADLMKELHAEAEAYRKEKKKSVVSGIHKYLDLLKDQPEYPCLRDADGDCISLPPITNSEKTKITKDSTDILVEVTSSKNLDTTKIVMEELLKSTLEMGVGDPVMSNNDCSSPAEGVSEDGEGDNPGANNDADDAEGQGQHSLTVEQVKITDHEGRLRVLYPSRDDLCVNPAFNVIRNDD